MPERAGSSTGRGSAEAKESKRQEIAAADCFQRYRVQRVRVEDIAQAAGISGTNFHHFFPSRSALINALGFLRADLDRGSAALQRYLDNLRQWYDLSPRPCRDQMVTSTEDVGASKKFRRAD